MGHTDLGRKGLGNYGFNTVGRTLYMVYLISPIVMMVVYSSTERGVFMTFIGNTYLGIGNLVLSFLFAIFIYLFFEFQVMKLLEIFIVDKFFSHDK